MSTDNKSRIKRRAQGGQPGAPSTLLNAELAYNEVDDTLYYGKGSGGSGGSATNIIPIAGPGAFVDRTSAQTVAGIKTFSSSPQVPTPASTDSSLSAATTEFVQKALAAPQAPNTVQAGPASGSTSAAPGYRALVEGDIPSIHAVKVSDFASAADARIAAQKGIAGGLATLDSTGFVPAAQLPSYVDDVLESSTASAFPATGETGKIYVAIDTKKIYRWSGSVYIELDPSPGSTDAVPEGSINLYFTALRVLNTVLAGFAAGANAAVSASDTVLAAVQKLQGQVNARLVAANNLSDIASPTIARTNLGLKDMSIQDPANVNITGGSITGITFDFGTF